MRLELIVIYFGRNNNKFIRKNYFSLVLINDY